ncbi:uncharacterized protein UDID_03099 [Ustilago sp. UG-2017a]|nr:uncharacterized protein UDID_03099 [Ustilago sp. UG-2017a]
MVKDLLLNDAKSLDPSSPVDASSSTFRPAKPARVASYDVGLPANNSTSSILGQQVQQVYERTPTTPTTPTFILSSSNLFGGSRQEKSGEPMLLGGWSRSKSSYGQGAKQRPSLHRPSTLLSENTKTDVATLASQAEDEKHTEKAALGSGGSLPGLPSFQHMLYTRKGRRSIALNLRAFSSNRYLIALVVLFFVSIRMLAVPSTVIETSVSGEITTHRASDAVFLNNWIEHVINHPVRARDKTGFAEMGLRTEMYSHLLRHATLPNFERMERALWPFVPGINQLRRWWQASVQAKPTPYAASGASATGSQLKENLLAHGFGRGPTVKPGSRGIVMSLGYKGSVFASQFISIIREKHRNDIPIELYYYGDSDLPAKYRDYLTKTYRNVRCVDLESLGLFDPDLVQLERQGFAIKPFALLATNFTEVMLADADAIMLENPDKFFEEPGYLDTGTLFFHDRDHQRTGADYVVQEFMNNQLSLRGPSPRLAQSEFWTKKGIFEQESGIVVVDKRKTDVFAALLFTAWQNMGEIRKKTTYRIWWGDKETFWLAFEFSNFPYYFVPRYAQAIGTTRMVTKAEKLAAAAKAKAKAAKAEAEKAKEEKRAPAEAGQDQDKKVYKKPAAVDFNKAGEAVAAPLNPDANPFKEGIQPGQPKLKAEPDAAAVAAKAGPVAPVPAAASSDDMEATEELCSEHPLHFLGADSEDANGDGVIDSKTLGRPAWFNGGILDAKVLSDETYIQPNTFTLDGEWEFLFEEEKWCIRNYTKGDIQQFDLTARIDEIKGIAKKAEDHFRAKIPKTKSVKEAVLEDK